MKARTIQGEDRERIITDIRAVQKINEAEDAVTAAEAEADKAYYRMVEGKDLEALRQLHKTCSELEPSIKESSGYGVVLETIEDLIRDEQHPRRKVVSLLAHGQAKA